MPSVPKRTANNADWNDKAVQEIVRIPYGATREGWPYIAGVKDVYTSEIVGYAMGERMTKELTGKALFMALRNQRPPAGLIHHSDRGSQYCAYDYRAIQEQFGLKTSMSRKEIFYNRQHRHSRLGNISPAAFRIKYYQMAA